MLPQKKSQTFQRVSGPITEEIGIFRTEIEKGNDEISQLINW